jgi:hypothetical protein
MVFTFYSSIVFHDKAVSCGGTSSESTLQTTSVSSTKIMSRSLAASPFTTMESSGRPPYHQSATIDPAFQRRTLPPLEDLSIWGGRSRSPSACVHVQKNGIIVFPMLPHPRIVCYSPDSANITIDLSVLRPKCVVGDPDNVVLLIEVIPGTIRVGAVTVVNS